MNRYLLIPTLLIVLVACTNERQSDITQTKDSLSEKKAIENSSYYKDFRAWVNDTLKQINKGNNPTEDEAFLSMDIIQSPDSMELVIRKLYKVDIPSNSYSPKAKEIISLLKEYDEMPANGNTIIFYDVHEYHRSMIPELKREAYSYYDNIRVFATRKGNKINPNQQKNRTEYSYLRGRLSGKKEYVDNREVASYSFIRQNNILIKRKH
ncbi:MAG: hypothetical protein M0D57_15495 [Sphingobacteriales bacterium JAD_PAG50586_3]|nr:MAG: hypothetical protein M0D57_15495 [Sphingobacteriales bacterium JAD_PAG50586_3]